MNPRDRSIEKGHIDSYLEHKKEASPRVTGRASFVNPQELVVGYSGSLVRKLPHRRHQPRAGTGSKQGEKSGFRPVRDVSKVGARHGRAAADHADHSENIGR